MQRRPYYRSSDRYPSFGLFYNVCAIAYPKVRKQSEDLLWQCLRLSDNTVVVYGQLSGYYNGLSGNDKI